MSHTKGPWTMGAGGFGKIYSGHGIDKTPICSLAEETHLRTYRQDEMFDNAILISASPELLRVLRAIADGHSEPAFLARTTIERMGLV